MTLCIHCCNWGIQILGNATMVYKLVPTGTSPNSNTGSTRYQFALLTACVRRAKTATDRLVTTRPIADVAYDTPMQLGGDNNRIHTYRMASPNKASLFTMERSVEKARQDRMRCNSSGNVMRLSQMMSVAHAQMAQLPLEIASREDWSSGPDRGPSDIAMCSRKDQ